MPSSPTRLSARRRKAVWREMLSARDHEALLRWARQHRQAARTAFSALFEADPLLRWRAIEALGLLARQQAATDAEVVREWIRRIFWNMNDESGGLMWHGPQAIAEILVNVPELIPEYLTMVACHHDEEPFASGTYEGLTRLAERAPGALAKLVPELRVGLRSTDPVIRASAARIISLTTDDESVDTELAAVLADPSPLEVYDHEQGTMRATSVAQYARQR